MFWLRYIFKKSIIYSYNNQIFNQNFLLICHEFLFAIVGSYRARSATSSLGFPAGSDTERRAATSATISASHSRREEPADNVFPVVRSSDAQVSAIQHAVRLPGQVQGRSNEAATVAATAATAAAGAAAFAAAATEDRSAAGCHGFREW